MLLRYTGSVILRCALTSNHHVMVAINQNQFDALVSFDFNTGALDKSNVLSSINGGRMDQVESDLLMWDHAGGRVLLGLLRRRKAEATLFNQPVIPPVVTS